MSIVPAELRWFRSQVVSDASSNGGRMSAIEAPNGVKNAILPDVTLAERTAGITRFRKMFIKVANDDDLVLYAARVFEQLGTPGADNVTFFPGSQRDTQGSLSGTERLYGSGKLNANVAAGATSFVVATEGAALNYIRNGDLLRITNKTTLADTGAEEFVTATGVSYAGDLATVTIASPGLANAYNASNSSISSVYAAGDVKTNVSVPAKTSAAGTINAGAPILGDNLGTVEQDWTVTFTTATAFTIVGDQLGSVGSGNTTSDATPGNPLASGKPYFTLPAGFWGGTWAPGDTVTFTTNPAAVPIWYRHNVPAGAAVVSGNRVIIGIDGESA